MPRTIELQVEVMLGKDAVNRKNRAQFIAQSILRACYLDVTGTMLESKVTNYSTVFSEEECSDDYTRAVIHISDITDNMECARISKAIKLMNDDARINSAEAVEIYPNSNEVRFRLTCLKEENGETVTLADPRRNKDVINNKIRKVISSAFNNDEGFNISFYYDSVLGDENILVVMEVVTKLKKDLERRVHILKSLNNVSRVTMVSGSRIN